ncbi:MAG: tripartite tricarboxylate transporter substrate binding protein [Acetobacteraceae bacterium]|nr:tripartite tricarboxylate transporter substrate binding protein [Acetobacteraceae bacterium]
MTLTRRPLLLGALAAPFAAPSVATRAAAQGTWPSRPVRIIVPFAPGGSVDTMGRAIAQSIQERTGQTVTVENRSGANGTVGGLFVAQSAPDGHTLCVSASLQTLARLIMRSPGYDPLSDLHPVARMGEGALILGTNPGRPQATMREIAEAARARPQEWSFGTSSLGSAGHLATIEFFRLIGADLTIVPYRGTSAALPDLAAGRIAGIFDPMLAMTPQVRGGTVRGVAITSPRRNDAVPDIATTAEQGFPSVDSQSWWGVWAPRGVPDATLAAITEQLRLVSEDAGVRQRLTGLGITTMFEPGAAFTDYIRRDYARTEQLLRLARFEPE